MSDADTIRRLRDELDEAHETIRQLREGAGIVFDADLPDWLPYLTPQEDKVFRILADGQRWRRDRIMDRLFGHLPAPPEQKIVDVVLSRLRSKLAPVGIRFNTLHSRGWALDPKSLALLRGDQPSKSRISHHSAVHGESVAA